MNDLFALNFWLSQAEGANAAEDEVESEKSMSEVNDEDEGDEDGSDEVCLNSLVWFCIRSFESLLIDCFYFSCLQEDDDE
jgi:hypothetical protein